MPSSHPSLGLSVFFLSFTIKARSWLSFRKATPENLHSVQEGKKEKVAGGMVANIFLSMTASLYSSTERERCQPRCQRRLRCHGPALKCSIAVCPHDGREFGVPFPAELSASVPVLFLCGAHDKEANSQTHAWVQYRKTSAPKLIFEISGGDHFSANGPAGGTEKEFEKGFEPCALCNCCCAMCCCGFAPCPYGSLNGPSGHATNDAPRGAIGGVALAWLQLFLLGDESARSRLAARPDIASGFESQKMDRS